MHFLDILIPALGLWGCGAVAKGLSISNKGKIAWPLLYFSFLKRDDADSKLPVFLPSKFADHVSLGDTS